MGPALLALLAPGCGNSNVDLDATADAATDGPSCSPVPLSPEAGVPTMHPPNAPAAGKCSSQQISDYVACDLSNSSDTSKCDQFLSGQPGAPCAACIESQASAASWGVIVFNGTTGTPNIGGCVDDALGQVGMEPNSCGQLLYASYTCQNTVCNACTGNQQTFDASDFDTCDAIAVSTVCSSENAAVQSPTGPCAPLLGDAGLTGPAAACFPDTSIQDPIQQETCWLTGIITYMCGAGSGPTSCP